MSYLSQGYATAQATPATAGFSRHYAASTPEHPPESRLEYIARSDSAGSIRSESIPAPYAQNILPNPPMITAQLYNEGHCSLSNVLRNIPEDKTISINYFCPPLYNTFMPLPAGNPYLQTTASTPFLSYRAGDILPYQSPVSDAITHMFMPRAEYHFQPELFLKPGKEGRFVGKAEEIREDIEKAFELLLGEPFPDDIKLSVLPAGEFRKLAPHPSTVGISFNRRRYGLLSEIFVLNDSLGRVMLTIGHELGHVLTAPLEEKLDEEAKAYAFSLRWMEIIRQHDIAGLADALVAETPAENGLHDVAFSFVHGLLRGGKSAGEIHLGLTGGTLALAG